MAEAASKILRRIYGNLGKLLGGKAAAGVLSLASVALAARALGPAEFGALVIVQTYVLTVGSLIEFPGWHAIIRYGAEALADEDNDRLARLMAFAGGLELGCGGLALATAALLGPVVARWMEWPPEAVALSAISSLMVLATVRSTPGAYLQLTRRFTLLSAHHLVAPAVRLAGAGVAMMAGGGLTAFLIAWLIAAIAECLAMWLLAAFAARGSVTLQRLTAGMRGVTAENPGIWRFMWAGNLDQTVSELSDRIAPLVIGSLVGPASAGTYAVAQRVAAVLAMPAAFLGQAAYAELAHLAASGGSPRDIGRVVRQASGGAVLVATPAWLFVAAFSEQLAVFVAGEHFATAGQIMGWLALAKALLLATPPVGAALAALGHTGLSLKANLISAVVALTALPLLLQAAGLLGAGVQAVVQAALAVALLVGFLMRVLASRTTANAASQSGAMGRN